MAAVVVIEAAAIVLLLVLVSGLLRSHADILRALHRLGVDLDGDGVGRDIAIAGRQTTSAPIGGASAISVGDGRAALDLSGLSPSDEMLAIAVAAVTHDTLLAFLTTGCTTCATFWRRLAEPGLAVPGAARVVIVVHSPDEESVSRVRSLAPKQVPVVMSSQSWDDYGVTYAPYFVYVSGPAGRVVGEGVAGNWDELSSLLGQAIDDGAATRSSARTDERGRRRLPDQDRAERVDGELRRAGILPGDPQLYPTRLEAPPAATDVGHPDR